MCNILNILYIMCNTIIIITLLLHFIYWQIVFADCQQISYLAYIFILLLGLRLLFYFHYSVYFLYCFILLLCNLARVFFLKTQAKRMFDGEMASLDAILRTETVRVPKPVKVIELHTGGSAFAMEHLDMIGLTK